MARTTYRMPPREPGKRFVWHHRTAKLIAPHNAGAYPHLVGNMGEDDTSADDSNATIRPKISKESGELTFVLMPVVPLDHEHTKPVHFISFCNITQVELDAKVMTPGYENGGDELITIQIIDSETHDYHRYTEQRSILSISPTLENFFYSVHFQPHAETTLIFTKYSALCLETALCHLCNGDSAIVLYRAQLMKFKISVRVTLVIELYRLAKALDIPGLTCDTYTFLCQVGHLLTPAHCIMLVKMFYGIDAVRDTKLKVWANHAIATHLPVLDTMPEFVHLRKTTWLKYEYDRMPTYDALPHADEGFVLQAVLQQRPQEVEQQVEAVADFLMTWEAGAPPGSQLGPSPPPKDKAGKKKKGGKGGKKGGKVETNGAEKKKGRFARFFLP